MVEGQSRSVQKRENNKVTPLRQVLYINSHDLDKKTKIMTLIVWKHISNTKVSCENRMTLIMTLIIVLMVKK